MKKYVWKTQDSSKCYVDANTGDDINGDGSMQNPFRSLGRSTRGTTKKEIVCRGVFSEDLADSRYLFLYADYQGAAFFDGKEDFLIMCVCYDMIIRDCCEARWDMQFAPEVDVANAGVPGKGNGYIISAP